MRWPSKWTALVLVLLAVGQGSAQAQSGSPERAAATSGELIRIPRAGTDGGMLTRVCRPAGAVAAPLVVVNHGSPPVAAHRATRQPSQCGEVARFFNDRGFVVAFPLRRGYGASGGAWAEAYGRCNQANFEQAGLASADDIAAALAHLRTLPYVAKVPAIIVGQSAGGWGTIALASRNPPEIASYINFAGGRGARLEEDRSFTNCSVERLVEAASAFGRRTKAEMLWIYTQNDRLIPMALSRRLHAAYVGAGGKARYELLAPFGADGHTLFFARGGSATWGPVVDRWLAATAPR